MSASSCPRCGQPLEKQPAQYVLRRGEHFFAFEGVPVRVCLACDWRTVTRADIYVMEQALTTGAVSAKGILVETTLSTEEDKRISAQAMGKTVEMKNVRYQNSFIR